MNIVIDRLKQFPKPIQIAMGLMVLNALLLILWWIFIPDSVLSNGAHVFFITVWLGAAWGTYLGESWIRVGIVAIVVAFIWGLINQPTIQDGLAAVSYAELISKITAVICAVLLYLPQTNAWFRSMRFDKSLELEQKGSS